MCCQPRINYSYTETLSTLLNHIILCPVSLSHLLAQWPPVPPAPGLTPSSTNVISFSSAYASPLEHLLGKCRLLRVVSALCLVANHTTESPRTLAAIRTTTSTTEPSVMTNTANTFSRCTLRDGRSTRISTWTTRCSTSRRQCPSRRLLTHILNPRTPWLSHHRIVIDTVAIPFLCEETGRSVYVLCGSLKPSGEEIYKLTVQYGTKFDVVVGYVAAEISFRQVASALLESSSEQIPRLSSVNEKLVRQYTQAVIGIHLDKIRRLVVDAKVWAFSIAFDSAPIEDIRTPMYVFVYA